MFGKCHCRPWLGRIAWSFQIKARTACLAVGGFRRIPICSYGDFDEARFEASLNRLIARHAALRTTFPSDAGAPRRRVAASGEAVLRWVDLQNVNEADRERALELYGRLTEAERVQVPQALRVWLRYRSEKYFGDSH